MLLLGIYNHNDQSSITCTVKNQDGTMDNCNDISHDPSNCGETKVSFLFQACNEGDTKINFGWSGAKVNGKKITVPGIAFVKNVAPATCVNQTKEFQVNTCETFWAGLNIFASSNYGQKCSMFINYRKEPGTFAPTKVVTEAPTMKPTSSPTSLLSATQAPKSCKISVSLVLFRYLFYLKLWINIL